MLGGRGEGKLCEPWMAGKGLSVSLSNTPLGHFKVLN